MEEPEVIVGRRRGPRWHHVGHGLHRKVPKAAPAPTSGRSSPDAPLDARRSERLRDLRAWQEVLPPEACFSHLTAAEVHGLWLPPVPAGLPVALCLPDTGDRPRRPELHVSRLNRPVEHLVVDGVRVASVAETLLACARDLGLLDLVVLADSALREGKCDSAALLAVAAPRRRGGPTLRAAVPHVDRRSESPWESLLRMFHVLCGVPVEPQHEVYDAQGVFVARGDLWLRGTRTLHEYDGAVHRDRRTHIDDLARDRRLTNVGWTRRGYTSGDLLGRAHVMLREAETAIGREHDPRRLDAWRAALQGSLFSSTGRTRLLRRWGRG